MSHGRRTFRSLLWAGATLWFASAAGASPSAKLAYARGAGAEACPTEAALRQAVATRIGYDPFFPAASKSVIAQVTRAKSGYRGHIQIVGEDGNVRGERDLASSGEDCAELVHAVALAISIALDDLDEAAPSEKAAPPASPVEPRAPVPLPVPEESAPRERPPPRPVPQQHARVTARSSVGPTLSLGHAPAASVGGSVAVEVGVNAFSARLDVRADLPASAPLISSGRVATRSVAGTLSGCARRAVPFACVGLGSGFVWSSTDGISTPASDNGRLLFLSARVGAALSLGSRVYLEPSIEGALSLAPYRIHVENGATYTSSSVAVTTGLHVGARFF
jgi:hypothetical protein